jgi:hypothetical protein
VTNINVRLLELGIDVPSMASPVGLYEPAVRIGNLAWPLEVGVWPDTKSVVGVIGYVRWAPGFSEQPAVVDGASEVLIQIWADAGRHSRTSIRVAELPGGAPVEVELTVEVHS